MAAAMTHAQSVFQVAPTANGNHGVRNNSLSAVAASSATDIWAVGQTTIHFDGTRWTAFNAPRILGDNTSILNGVVDLSPTEAWAVGIVNIGEANPGQVIEQWNGTQWSVYPGRVFNPGDQPSLYGMTAVAANDIWAVGALQNDDTRQVENDLRASGPPRISMPGRHNHRGCESRDSAVSAPGAAPICSR
jgi:hypothetical protein